MANFLLAVYQVISLFSRGSFRIVRRSVYIVLVPKAKKNPPDKKKNVKKKAQNSSSSRLCATPSPSCR